MVHPRFDYPAMTNAQLAELVRALASKQVPTLNELLKEVAKRLERVT